jgi:hypothetical protein
MIKISDHCRQLVGLKLTYYAGELAGPVIRRLLQSCPLLKSLELNDIISMDIEAYELLAILGGNLAELSLSGQTVMPSQSLSFGISSPIYESGFKQQRSRPMEKLIWRDFVFDMKSLAKFLSCFGFIDELTVQLDP